MGRTHITWLLVAILLGGCATAAQRQAASIASQAIEAKDNAQKCASDIAAEPQFASVVKHFPIGGEAPTLEQRANTSLPTPLETKAVIAWRSNIATCQTALNNSVQNFAPAFLPTLVESQNAQDAVWVKLVHSELSWGSAVQQLADIRTTYQEKGQQVIKEMTADLKHEHEAELAQRQAVANAFAQAARDFQEQQNEQQLINSLNRPRTTNCSAFGNSATCTTY